MKICVAQTRPIGGEIEQNIENHIKLINLAASHGAEMIVFPELSLTKYDSLMAAKWATAAEDYRFDIFQEISNLKHITIGVGFPLKSSLGIFISMLIFQANLPRQTYSKQYLHADELPFFVNGQNHFFLTIQNHKISPAICYESLLDEHNQNAFKNGADIYITSVAKSANGIEKVKKHYPEIAKKYKMTILMSNCLGKCDDFESVGNSAIWNKKGEILGQLDNENEGILIFDTENEAIFEATI